jgi:hypothetical protein
MVGELILKQDIKLIRHVFNTTQSSQGPRVWLVPILEEVFKCLNNHSLILEPHTSLQIAAQLAINRFDLRILTLAVKFNDFIKVSYVEEKLHEMRVGVRIVLYSVYLVLREHF